MRNYILGLIIVTCSSSAFACQEIQQVINHSKNGFNQIRGGYDSYYEAYSTSYLLPGASECDITYDDVDRNYSYSCDWRSQDKEKMQNAYNEILNLVRTCLKKYNPKEREFRRGKRERSSSISGPSISTSFYPSSDFKSATVMYREWTNKRRWETTYSVSLDIDQKEK